MNHAEAVWRSGKCLIVGETVRSSPEIGYVLNGSRNIDMHRAMEHGPRVSYKSYIAVCSKTNHVCKGLLNMVDELLLRTDIVPDHHRTDFLDVSVDFNAMVAMCAYVSMRLSRFALGM